MSIETFPIDTVGPENFPLIANVLLESNDVSLPEHFITQMEVVEVSEFSGRLVIPDHQFNMPVQNFVATFSDFGATFENKHVGFWPRIFIEFSSNEPLGKSKAREFFERLKTPGLRVKNFLVRPSSDTVDAEVLYTRVMSYLYKINKCSLHTTEGKLFGISFDPISEMEERQFLDRAKLYRKLKFIQNVFRVQFALPQNIPASEVRGVEIVFRGITEGVFAQRSPEFTFPDISPSEINLTKPPFDGVGSFSRKLFDRAYLLGRRLDAGPVTVSLEKAELADPNVARQIRSGSTQPIDVRFAVLDKQIIFRFESYARHPRKRLLQRLNRFKQQLAREEPPELVNLLTESLQRDVSSEEALQIAMGWTQYNDLPDRYCPQEPEIDSATGHWRVPVWLVYTGGEGRPVGELMIDKKTGVIINHTPIEEMRSRASSFVNEYDEEVLATARKFMDRHDKLLRRLAE